MGLPLLPCHAIVMTWNELKRQQVPGLTPDDRKNFTEYKKYVTNQWIRTIRPAELNVAFCQRRTNNDCKNFNRLLNQRTRVAHPACISYAKVVADQLTKAATEITTLAQGNPVRRDYKNMFQEKKVKLSWWQGHISAY